MADSALAPSTFTLALTHLDGVGRVTARRLSERFSGPEDLRAHSREQVLLRIKGVAKAEEIVRRLFETDALADALTQAQTRVEALGERGVRLLSAHSEAWPAGLDALPAARRPLLLWVHGAAEVLSGPSAAFLARAPLDEAPFERAQALAQHLAGQGTTIVLAAQSGFDVALTKRAAAAGAPVVLVASCGLAKLARPMRPVASQAVRAGGALLSPFPMTHGPFDHDDRERALVQAALARTAVFAPPEPKTPEARALAWTAEAERPAFVLAGEAHDGAHPVRDPAGFAPVLDAARPPSR